MRLAAQPLPCRLVYPNNLCRKLCRELCRVFEEAYESVCMAPARMAPEALKPGLKPLARFRLKAGLRQGWLVRKRWLPRQTPRSESRLQPEASEGLQAWVTVEFTAEAHFVDIARDKSSRQSLLNRLLDDIPMH